jgi:hypothetical protein
LVNKLAYAHLYNVSTLGDVVTSIYRPIATLMIVNIYAPLRMSSKNRWGVAILLTFIVGQHSLGMLHAADEKPVTLKAVTSFPGGSGDATSIDQVKRTIRIRPSKLPDRGWSCWWYFHVTGIRPGEEIKIELSGDSFTLADQPTFSLDNKTWQHGPAGKREQGKISYNLKIDGSQAWFAWGPPFTSCDATQLIRSAEQKSKAANSFELCKSRDSRAVQALRIESNANNSAGKANTSPYGVWIVARQHAWESGSSWVCRGLTEWLLSDDPRAAELRSKAEFNIVPIMDLDNVERGAGGKEEKPQDHNRDWTDEPYHPAVAAVQKKILEQNKAGRLDLFIDLHNPGPGDKSSFFFISPRSILAEEGWANVDRFLNAANAEMRGPLPLRGPMRESGPSYDARWQQIGKNWVTMHASPHVVSVTLETTWNTPQATTDGYLTTGRELGQAIERYFRERPRKLTAE